MDISVEVTVNAPVEKVWAAWTTPEQIVNWNFASDDWHCPKAELELHEGGRFSYRMEATDGTAGFDFQGTFKTLELQKLVRYIIDDEREVTVQFLASGNSVLVKETFQAEKIHTEEQQRQGWQSILNNFKRYVENSA